MDCEYFFDVILLQNNLSFLLLLKKIIIHRFSCMNMIEKDEADLIALDSGQGYFAGRQYNMMPIMAEDYENSIGKLNK